MKEHQRSSIARAALLLGLLPPLLACGCKSHLAFGTATKFGLDITQKPDQTIEVSMGYRRAEMASIPVAADDAEPGDADASKDAYSVLGRFRVSYGNPWTGEGLQLKQFFATGMAAREAAGDERMRKAFGQAAYEIQTKDGASK